MMRAATATDLGWKLPPRKRTRGSIYVCRGYDPAMAEV